MTSGITQNPHVSVVFLEGVQRRVALGSSVSSAPAHVMLNLRSHVTERFLSMTMCIP
jgi:hypothetical protein